MPSSRWQISQLGSFRCQRVSRVPNFCVSLTYQAHCTYTMHGRFGMHILKIRARLLRLFPEWSVGRRFERAISQQLRSVTLFYLE